MARGRNVINQSIALEGGDEIVAQLRKMGEEGEAAAKKLEAAFRNVNVGKSFGSAFANLKSSFASLQAAGSRVAESFGRVGGSISNVSGAFQSSAARIGLFTTALTGAAVGAGAFIKGSLESLGQLNDLSEFLVAQRPSFWLEFGSRLGKALLPLAWRCVSKRMPPEEEVAWREAERRGQGDDWLKERRRRRAMRT